MELVVYLSQHNLSTIILEVIHYLEVFPAMTLEEN